MEVHRFKIVEGPPERALLFSLSDPSYQIAFKVDAPHVRFSDVLIKGLFRTDNPSTWAWRGRIKARGSWPSSEFWAWGLLDVQKRKGIALMELPKIPEEIKEYLLLVRHEGLHPVETRISEQREARERLKGKGPRKDRMVECERMLARGEEPFVTFESPDRPEEIAVKLTRIEREENTFFFEGEIPGASNTVFHPVRGMWSADRSQGAIFYSELEFPFRALEHVQTQS